MNQSYGIFKKATADNHYVSLAKSLNSAHTTKETQPTLKNLTGECSHGGYLVIHKGYRTFRRVKAQTVFDRQNQR